MQTNFKEILKEIHHQKRIAFDIDDREAWDRLTQQEIAVLDCINEEATL